MKAAASIGLQPAPARAPRRIGSTGDLRALQRLMTHMLVRPLAAGDRMQRQWSDGRPMAEVAADFIKPNDRLSSLERLEIYARCYWYRILDGMNSDCAALRACLGERRFSALASAYLAARPSSSYTMRNLCRRLPEFIREQPRWTAPRTALAEQIARFEWAQTVAFDGEARPKLTRDEIADAPPARLRLGLQPYVSLLRLDWAIDDYVIRLKKREALRGEASNTLDHAPRVSRRRPPEPPRRERVHLVVHRFQERLYYKRVDQPGFAILQALAEGKTVTTAVAAGGRGVQPEQVRDWFASWMELGWFCRRAKAAGNR